MCCVLNGSLSLEREAWLLGKDLSSLCCSTLYSLSPVCIQSYLWRHHGKLVMDAHQIWLAAIGPDTPANGEVNGGKKYYQKQIAQTIAHLLGKNYTDTHPVGDAIDILVK